MTLQTNTEQYRRNFIQFSNAFRAFVAKNGKQAVTKDVIVNLLKQAQTKYGLQVVNGKIVPPTPIQMKRPVVKQVSRPVARPVQKPVKSTNPLRGNNPFGL